MTPNLPATTTLPPVDEVSLFAKLRRYGLAAGREAVEKVLWLWFASRRPLHPRLGG